MDPNGIPWGVSSTFTSPTIIRIQQLIKCLVVPNTINVLQ